MKIEIDIYAWPTRETEDPLGLQADIFENGEEVAGMTAPGGYQSMFWHATELINESWKEWGRD